MTRAKTAAGRAQRGVAGAAPRPAAGGSKPADGKRCRQCGGWSQTRAALGWLAVSVGVPPELDPHGFKWVGVFSSADCLVACGPEIQRMEQLAGQVRARAPAVTAPLEAKPEPAYTTVVTIVGNLWRKHLVRRMRAGHAHRHAPSLSRGEHLAHKIGGLIVFAGDPGGVIQHALHLPTRTSVPHTPRARTGKGNP